MSSAMEAMSKIEQILHEQYDLLYPTEDSAESALITIVQIVNETLNRPIPIVIPIVSQNISDVQVVCEAVGCVCHSAQHKRLRPEHE